MFEIDVERTFHASHALRLPDGSLEPVHAHDWQVVVTVAAAKLDSISCVMDFHRLEKLLEDVVNPWRDQHLNDVLPFADALNPSAERVAEQIALALADHLPQRVQLKCVTVTEAPGCRARYMRTGQSNERRASMAISDQQYGVVASRRLATNGLVWQTPVLSLTAQAFLFTIALGSSSSGGARIIAAILALVASLASIQLMAKHRFLEERDSHLLKEYEDRKDGFQPIHGPLTYDHQTCWYLKVSSYRIWLVLLTVFAMAAVVVIVGVLESWEWLLGGAY